MDVGSLRRVSRLFVLAGVGCYVAASENVAFLE